MRIAGAAALLSWVSWGCGAPDERGFDLSAALADEPASVGPSATTVEFGDAELGDSPSLEDVWVGEQRRTAVVTDGSGWRWSGAVPERARLRLGLQLVREDAEKPPPCRVVVRLRIGSFTEILEVVRLGGLRPERWIDLSLDVSHHAGKSVVIEAAIDRCASDDLGAPRLAWSPALLTAARPAERPNIVLFVVDTLRADRLTPYGYSRDTSPVMQSVLADQGLVVEKAYAQAPWTLPSVVSMMTGRYPGELVRRDMRRYGVPGDVPTLAEHLSELGYVTAGFFGNGLLREENGLANGFDVFYSPAVDAEGFVPAHKLNRIAAGWVAAQTREPFFLYMHYTDPHASYDNPDLREGRSRFYPDYAGELDGHVEQLVRGEATVVEDSDDHRHLNALYDSEILYVDRHIGELLDLLTPEVQARTLMALTSDHGEELLDHRGWGHSRTLYEELIHVPLILRWDGRLEAGSRVDGTARLVDLLPTLISAAGGELPDSLSGTDLLPHLQRGRLPALPVYAQAFFRGPTRGAAILDGLKLLLFNQADRRPPISGADSRLVELDRERLQRMELYDLANDPEERTNLASSDASGRIQHISRAIHEHLDTQFEGLRIIGTGVPRGSELEIRVRFASDPRSWWPYFLSAEDEVRLQGENLVITLEGDGLDKGIVLQGVDSIVNVSARLDGRELGGEEIRAGTGAWGAGPIGARDLFRGRGWPESDRPGVHLWYGEPLAPEPTAPDPESELVRQLQALGYLDG